MNSLGNYQHQEITDMLLGHKVIKVDEDTLRLDNGTLLRLRGNRGGCICSAGDYDLTDLNGIDNIITNVEFNDDPASDYNNESEGVYQIFVYAENTRVNLATFSGNDGSGYYGTGYSIEVIPVGVNKVENGAVDH